jgi:hypothetical protein
LGFQRIVCPTKTWVLSDEASVCYLWSTDPEDPRSGRPGLQGLREFFLIKASVEAGRRQIQPDFAFYEFTRLLR